MMRVFLIQSILPSASTDCIQAIKTMNYRVISGSHRCKFYVMLLLRL